MKKIDFTKFKTNFANFKINPEKLKITVDKAIVRAVLISFLTMVVTLGIIALLVWHYRAKIFSLLAVGYVRENQIEDTVAGINSITGEKNTGPNELSELIPILSQENTVVSAVKKANPAVVSIIITKDVPKYEVSYEQTNPFGDFFGFPDTFFQTPTYRQNGTEKKQIGGGSGFLISADGLIVTNRHVVSDTSAEYTVFLNNGKKYTAKILARDPVLDVAIAKITPSGLETLPYLELGDSDTLEVGQSVVAIGNALGEFKNTVSAGVVSGLSRSLIAGDNAGNSEQLDKVIQTDAAINPGNSGGPLLDLSGKVVGINVAVVQGSENIGFALPINSVKNVISSVRKTGKIIRPYVGIRYIPITPELKSKNNLSVDYGILVQRGSSANQLAVVPGSPADKAGIVENDIILEVNGQKINNETNFATLIRGKNIGETLVLKILSKGLEKTVYLTLTQAPDGQ